MYLYCQLCNKETYYSSTTGVAAIFDPSAAGDRGYAKRIVKLDLRGFRLAHATHQVEEGTSDRPNARRQNSRWQKYPHADRYQRISQLHLHRKQRAWHDRGHGNDQSSM